MTNPILIKGAVYSVHPINGNEWSHYSQLDFTHGLVEYLGTYISHTQTSLVFKTVDKVQKTIYVPADETSLLNFFGSPTARE